MKPSLPKPLFTATPAPKLAPMSETVCITFRADRRGEWLGSPDVAPMAVRVRKLLKDALRRHGLRCVRVTEVQP